MISPHIVTWPFDCFGIAYVDKRLAQSFKVGRPRQIDIQGTGPESLRRQALIMRSKTVTSNPIPATAEVINPMTKKNLAPTM